MTASAFSLDKTTLNYVSDESGQKTAVLVPIEVWTEIIALLEMNTLKGKLKVALQEVDAIEKGELPEVSPKVFLDES
jgi:hypothetical protein